MFHMDGLQPLNAPRNKTLATATLKEGQYIKKLYILKGAAKHSGRGGGGEFLKDANFWLRLGFT